MALPVLPPVDGDVEPSDPDGGDASDEEHKLATSDPYQL